MRCSRLLLRVCTGLELLIDIVKDLVGFAPVFGPGTLLANLGHLGARDSPVSRIFDTPKLLTIDILPID